jgi:hypothetical protein
MNDLSALRGLAAALLGAALAGLAPPAAAQDGREIHIHMKDDPYRIHKVTPTAKGVCRGETNGKPNKKDDCEDQVAWVLKGANLKEGWSVEVQLKKGYPKCFARETFILTR